MKIKFYIKKTEIALYQLLSRSYDLWVVEYDDVFAYSTKSPHTPLTFITTVSIADGGIKVVKRRPPKPEKSWHLGSVISHVFIPFSSINFYEINQGGDNDDESY